MTLAAAQRAIVIDASAAMALLGGDEQWIERWHAWLKLDAMLLAPPHLQVEVANALLRGAGLTAVEAAARLERLDAIGVESADRGLPGLLGAVELAERHGLTVHDAVYLELALDVDAELATLDRKLAAAATSEQLTIAD